MTSSRVLGSPLEIDAPVSPVVTASDVSKVYGAGRALDGFSGTSNPGQLVAIVGKSGSGKTTLLRCLAGAVSMTATSTPWSPAMILTAELRETAFDPLFGAQAMFRRLLEATARPGLVVALGEVPLVVPPARLRPACVLLLALMDREVTFSVVGPQAETVREYLRFNTGAHATAVAAADFVLVTASGRDWSGARRGTLEAPHESATVVLTPDHVGGAAEDADVTLRLTGPGIAREASLPLQGLTILDVAPLVERADFPLGADVWFAGADGHLAVVPRSTRCRVAGA